jgi:hypothetical protein
VVANSDLKRAEGWRRFVYQRTLTVERAVALGEETGEWREQPHGTCAAGLRDSPVTGRSTTGQLFPRIGLRRALRMGRTG